jgi:two-component system OmpR family response regulator
MATRSLRILIIDDQRDAVLTLERLLGRLGHQVGTARNGADGLRVAREVRPEIIFCDIGLPDMSGYEVAKAIRAEESFGGAVLIAVTGFSGDEDRDRALAAGFDQHVVKPVAFSDLTQLLDSV